MTVTGLTRVDGEESGVGRRCRLALGHRNGGDGPRAPQERRIRPREPPHGLHGDPDEHGDGHPLEGRHPRRGVGSARCPPPPPRPPKPVAGGHPRSRHRGPGRSRVTPRRPPAALPPRPRAWRRRAHRGRRRGGSGVRAAARRAQPGVHPAAVDLLEVHRTGGDDDVQVHEGPQRDGVPRLGRAASAVMTLSASTGVRWKKFTGSGTCAGRQSTVSAAMRKFSLQLGWWPSKPSALYIPGLQGRGQSMSVAARGCGVALEGEHRPVRGAHERLSGGREEPPVHSPGHRDAGSSRECTAAEAANMSATWEPSTSMMRRLCRRGPRSGPHCGPRCPRCAR